MQTTEQHLWVEKFRPRKVKDCILPGGLKQTLQAIVDSGEMQNLLFSGENHFLFFSLNCFIFIFESPRYATDYFFLLLIYQ